MNKIAVKPKLVALAKWQSAVGISPVTIWRWRQKGWLPTVNISGRLYVDELEIEGFLERAKQGRFAQVANITQLNNKRRIQIQRQRLNEVSQ